jgi:hypothetical protein
MESVRKICQSHERNHQGDETIRKSIDSLCESAKLLDTKQFNIARFDFVTKTSGLLEGFSQSCKAEDYSDQCTLWRLRETLNNHSNE